MTSSNRSIFSITGPLCGTQSFDVFFDLRLNKRLSKHSWAWWFETPSRSLWRHCNVVIMHIVIRRHLLLTWTQDDFKHKIDLPFFLHFSMVMKKQNNKHGNDNDYDYDDDYYTDNYNVNSNSTKAQTDIFNIGQPDLTCRLQKNRFKTEYR